MEQKKSSGATTLNSSNSSSSNNNNNHSNNNNNKANNEHKMQHQQQPNMMGGGIISRERSFVRTSNQQHNSNNSNKRRSLAFNMQQQSAAGQHQHQQQQQQQHNQQIRNKPAMDIYRPPSLRHNHQVDKVASNVDVNAGAGAGAGGSAVAGVKTLNINAPDFLYKNSRSTVVFPSQQHFGNAPHMLNRRQAGLSLSSALPLTPMALNNKNGQRAILAGTHSHGVSYMPMGGVSTLVPLLNSPSSGNILTQTSVNRVKFAAEPGKRRSMNVNNNNQQQYMQQKQQQQHHQQQQQQQQQYVDPYSSAMIANTLQRSKSLSSADALARGIAGLGLGLGDEVTGIGQFPPDIQALIDNAIDDPNKLNSRCLMELSVHFMKRALEGRRYALPIARYCLSIIAKEHKETFLEALLNTCRQWYQEREKLLFVIQGMKSPSRVRFTSFMAFLTEMFCQLKRRQLQLRTQCEGVSPPLVLLTLLAKCCEDCVKPPVRSLSEIECLFYVLTCIGQDLEQQLPQQLEVLLSQIRDAFLNANDSALVIRRTLLQLIELQASHWQLPGNTVLYYYPAANQSLQRT